MIKNNLLDKKHERINTLNPIVSYISTIMIVLCLFLISCANPLDPVDEEEGEMEKTELPDQSLPQVQPIDSEEEDMVKNELLDRSFRQFAPSRDALKRKGAILDFFDNDRQVISLWAQYAEGDTALNEWEIIAADYRVEKGGSEYRLYFESPSSHQNLPNQCENCIEHEGMSISVRNLFDKEKIEFRINDPEDSLPIPFPVFNTWTKFNEDEYFD